MKLRLISMAAVLGACSMGFSGEETNAPALVPAAQTAPAIKRFKNSVGMELVAIPTGSYLCYGREIKPEFLFPKPKGFTVKIDREFYLGTTEVTQAQYLKIMNVNPSVAKTSKDCPVNRVSWQEAIEFCRKLSEFPTEKAAGRVYSLPTEREWQYAARAGSEFLFPYGNDDEMRAAEVAVCRDIYTNALPKGVQPVGKKNPNAWGLYDVLGNVWEWVQDSWSASQDQSPSSVVASSSAAAVEKGENRIIVGGGWDNDFRMCNLAARYSAPPTRVADNIGFRVRCETRPPSE